MIPLAVALSTDDRSLLALAGQLRRDLTDAEDRLRRQEALLAYAVGAGGDPAQPAECRRLLREAADLARRRVVLTRQALALVEHVEHAEPAPRRAALKAR